MSKPLVVNTVHPHSFETRLKLVSAAVQQRIQDEPQANPNHLRARLWVSWLKKNALVVSSQPEVQA